MANAQQQNGQSKKFDVHIYTQVRVKVRGIEAASPIEAIRTAENCVDFHGLFLSSNPGFGAAETEWAEPQATDEYLVDEIGDEEYRHSRWYKWKDGKIVLNVG